MQGLVLGVHDLLFRFRATDRAVLRHDLSTGTIATQRSANSAVVPLRFVIVCVMASARPFFSGKPRLRGQAFARTHFLVATQQLYVRSGGDMVADLTIFELTNFDRGNLCATHKMGLESGGSPIARNRRAMNAQLSVIRCINGRRDASAVCVVSSTRRVKSTSSVAHPQVTLNPPPAVAARSAYAKGTHLASGQYPTVRRCPCFARRPPPDDARRRDSRLLAGCPMRSAREPCPSVNTMSGAIRILTSE